MQQYRKNLGKVSLTAEGVWDVKSKYGVLSIVYDEHTQHGFISKQHVPIGVDLYNSEYWMPLNVSGYADSNIIILNKKTSDASIESYTLEEAVKSIASVGRKPGCILGFYNSNANRLDIGGRWEIWQFNSTTISEWEDLSNWQNIYYNYNQFVGWYRNEEQLKVNNPYPEIGCYAYVGNILNEAVVYRCEIKHKWTETVQRAWDYVKIMIDGTVTVGENGNWYNNGKDTGIPVNVKGDPGLSPFIRYNTSTNKLEYSYDKVKWIECSDYISTWFRLNNNKLEISRDNAKWNPVSDYIAAWFRWQATAGDTQANNVGRIQMSRDNGKTWTNMSNDFTNNLHISRYIGVNESLPTSGIAEGTIYAKGPYYAEGDASNNNPIYRLWVYAWKDNTLDWQDNGEFTSIAAGVVQETGDSETKVMSQKAVTKELFILSSEVGKLNLRKDPIIKISSGDIANSKKYTITFSTGTSGEIYDGKGNQICVIEPTSSELVFELKYGDKLIFNPTSNEFKKVSGLNEKDDGLLMLAIVGTEKQCVYGLLSNYVINYEITNKTDGTTINLRKRPIVDILINNLGSKTYTIKFLENTTGDIFTEKGENITPISITNEVSYTISYGDKLVYNLNNKTIEKISGLWNFVDGILLVAVVGGENQTIIGPLSCYILDSEYANKLELKYLNNTFDIESSINTGAVYANDYGFNIVNSTYNRACSKPFHAKSKFIYVKCEGYEIAIQQTNINNTGSQNGMWNKNVLFCPFTYSFGALQFRVVGDRDLTIDDINTIKNRIEVKFIDTPSNTYSYINNIPFGRKMKNFLVSKYKDLDVPNAHCQGCDVYNDTLFMVEDSGPEYKFWIYDMIESKRVSVVDAPIPIHYNNIMFSNIYPSNNNQYPYLYVNAWDGYRWIYALEVTKTENNYVLNIAHSIRFNVNGDILGNGQLDFAIDFDNNYLYTISYDEIGNGDNLSALTKVCKFSLPNVSILDVELNDNDVIDSFNITNIPARQCVKYKEGCLFVLSGYNDIKLYSVDVNKKAITSEIDFSGFIKGYEAEAFIEYDERFLIIRAGTAELTEILF